jgi:hypothetical protein
MADFLRVGASQQEHQNKDECRSHERKIRRSRYGISNQIVFEHDQPPLNHQAISHTLLPSLVGNWSVRPHAATTL